MKSWLLVGLICFGKSSKISTCFYSILVFLGWTTPQSILIRPNQTYMHVHALTYAHTGFIMDRICDIITWKLCKNQPEVRYVALSLLQENQQILKKLFKRLDPTVSKVETDIYGELQVSVKYDAVNSNLLVYVIKCRDLGKNSISQKTADPFVTVIQLSIANENPLMIW